MSCIIVIGLPLSGKTIWVKNNLSNYTIYDDFITHYYNGEVIKACRSKNNVCLIDPRLCIPEMFSKYIGFIDECYGTENIQLILFENNPELCLNNTRNDNRKNIPNTIARYTTKYNLDHECYKPYSRVILPVFNHSLLC